MIAELINLLQSFENSRKKDSFSSLFVDADPGLFLQHKSLAIILLAVQVSVRLLIYFDQQMAKYVPAQVETEILNSSSFNNSEGQTGSSIVCLSNETATSYDNAIADSNPLASIGNMVNVSLLHRIVLL